MREILDFGTQYVWVIDPETLESYVAKKDSQTDLGDGILYIRELGIDVSLSEAIKED